MEGHEESFQTSRRNMNMEIGLPNESQILREKNRTFCGSFKVPLSKLKLEEIPNNPRQFDPKNAANILERFRLEKCNRLEPEHYVSALVAKADLPQSLQPHGNPFEEPHDFDPPQPLPCIDGEHRLEAANRFLAGEDRWWVANLYSDDISAYAKTTLREQDSGSASYFDGDIYRQIRIAVLDKETSSEEKIARKNKWLARLSSAEKRRNISRMECSLVMREVRDGLDALIPFTGLWPALEMGHFKRLLDIHCPEEMTRYLFRIKQTWNYIIGDREDHQNKPDATTVYVLQGRCPFRSLDDRAYIEARLLKGDILPGSIPSHLSIHTFLEGTKWLEPGAAILKGILPTKCKDSLAQAFRALHNGQTRLKEQASAFSYLQKDLPTGSETEWLSYRQLWLIPLRHYPAPKKDCAKWKVRNVTGKRKRDREPQEVETTEPVGSGFRQHAGSADADTANSQEPEQLVLILAALLCHGRLLPYTSDDTVQPINGCYLADLDVLLSGKSLSNQRMVFERMGFSFLRVLTTFGDKYKDMIQLLAGALDKDPPFLEPFDGLTDQYVIERIRNRVPHLSACKEVKGLRLMKQMLELSSPSQTINNISEGYWMVEFPGSTADTANLGEEFSGLDEDLENP